MIRAPTTKKKTILRMSFNPLHGGTHKFLRQKPILSPQGSPHARNKFMNRPFSYSKKEPGSSVIFYAFLYAAFDRVALKLISLFCTFNNSKKCIKISFDSDSFSEELKGLFKTELHVFL